MSIQFVFLLWFGLGAAVNTGASAASLADSPPPWQAILDSQNEPVGAARAAATLEEVIRSALLTPDRAVENDFAIGAAMQCLAHWEPDAGKFATLVSSVETSTVASAEQREAYAQFNQSLDGKMLSGPPSVDEACALSGVSNGPAPKPRAAAPGMTKFSGHADKPKSCFAGPVAVVFGNDPSLTVVQARVQKNTLDSALLQYLQQIGDRVLIDDLVAPAQSLIAFRAGPSIPLGGPDLFSGILGSAPPAVSGATPGALTGPVDDQVKGIQALFAQGDAVLLVGHAESASYANQVYGKLGSPSVDLATQLQVVAVATAEEYVAGSGPYTNLETDTFVQLNHAWNPQSLPPNVTGGQWGDWNHDFAGAYLNLPQAKQKILGDIVQALKVLEPSDDTAAKIP